MPDANGPETSVLARCTCPHCWHRFRTGDILWISEHRDLVGDTVAGEGAYRRFLPTRFDLMGRAVDARGFACTQLACPRCHLPVPRPILESDLSFVSIFGSPNSGKSFYLASLVWELRQTLPARFKISITDADPVSNGVIREYEDSLFLNANADKLIPLGELIQKTADTGDLYDEVNIGGQDIRYPKPFLFWLRRQPGHPKAHRDLRGRVICMYDNAGESFEPGVDSTRNPVTRHLAESQLLLFVFDPLQNNRFRQRCQQNLSTTRSTERDRLRRQEAVLTEAASRVRRYAGLPETAKHQRPLIVVLTKFDQWSHLIAEGMHGPPFPEPFRGSDDSLHGLSVQRVAQVSQRVREVLRQLCPEIVMAAEEFAKEVIYVPVSSVGWETEVDNETLLYGIRPGKVKPFWVTVPILYGLSRSTAGWVPVVRAKGSRDPMGIQRTEALSLDNESE